MKPIQTQLTVNINAQFVPDIAETDLGALGPGGQRQAVGELGNGPPGRGSDRPGVS